MEQDTAQGATVATSPDGAVVAARGISRVYGEGDTAVQALRGVDLELAHGKFVAIMGP